MQYQLALCRSGFSWMMDGMRVEVCVLRSASTGDRDECGEAITECLEDDDGEQEDERQDDNVVALVKLPTSANSNGNTTNVSPSLAKRGVVAWAATMLLTEAGLTIGLLASLAALAIATTLVVSGKASSTSQVRNYWNEASQFERWTVCIMMCLLTYLYDTFPHPPIQISPRFLFHPAARRFSFGTDSVRRCTQIVHATARVVSF